ncbi:hypothetical protein YC2023_014625 [Brassica napus]
MPFIKILETLDYLDNLSKKELLTEQGDTITFESEVRIMQTLIVKNKWTGLTLEVVLDDGQQKTYVIGKEGLPDTVKNHTTFLASKFLLELCVFGITGHMILLDNPQVIAMSFEISIRVQISSLS